MSDNVFPGFVGIEENAEHTVPPPTFDEMDIPSFASRRPLSEDLDRIAALHPDRESFRAGIEQSILLADFFGVAPEHVYRNLAAYQRRFHGQEIDNRTALQITREAIRDGNLWVHEAQIGARLALDPGNSELWAQLQESMAMPRSDPAQGAVHYILQQGARMLPQLIHTTAEGMKAGAVLAGSASAVALAAGNAGPQAAFPEELGTVPISATTAFYIGTKAGSMVEAAELAVGSIFPELAQLEDEEGNRIPTGIVQAVSIGAAIPIALLESAQLGRLARPLQRLMTRAARDAAQTAALTGVMRTALRGVTKYAGNIVAETGQEVMQESVEIMAELIAVEIANHAQRSQIPQRDVDEMLAILRQVSIDSAAAFTLLGLPGTAAEVANFRQTGQATINGEQVDASAFDNLDDATLQSLLQAAQEDIDQATTSGEFEQFFGAGDDRSVVVDDQGNPQRVYSLPDDGAGPRFTTDREVAETEAGGVVRQVRDEDVRQALADEHPGWVSDLYLQIMQNDQRTLTAEVEAAYESRIQAWERQGNDVEDLVTVAKSTELAEIPIETEDAARNLGVQFPRPRIAEAYLNIRNPGTDGEVVQSERGTQYRVRGQQQIRVINAPEVRRLRPQVLRRDGRIVTQDEPGGIVAFNRNDRPAIRFSTEESPEGTRITGVEVIDPAAEGAQVELAQQIIEETPGQVFWDADEDIREQLANESPEVRGTAERIAEIDARLQDIDREIQEADQSTAPALAEEADSLLAERAQLDDQITDVAESYLRAGPSRRRQFVDAVVERAPKVSREQVEATLPIIEVFARWNLNMSLDQWLDRTLASEIVSRSTKGPLSEIHKAAVQFLDDGKALLHLGEKADVSSVLHELAHIIRRQVPDATDAALLEAYQRTAWDRSTEERFARDFEAYVMRGVAPSPELRTVFERLAEWMRELYRAVRSFMEPNAEVTQALDELFGGEDATSRQSRAEGEAILFQTEEEVRQRWENGEDVTIEELQEYAESEWSQQAIDRLRNTEATEAPGFVEDFREQAERDRNARRDDAEEITAPDEAAEYSTAERREWYDEQARTWRVPSRSEANRAFVRSVDRQMVDDLAAFARDNPEQAALHRLHTSFFTLARSAEASPRTVQTAQNILRQNPDKYAEIVATVRGDEVAAATRREIDRRDPVTQPPWSNPVSRNQPLDAFIAEVRQRLGYAIKSKDIDQRVQFLGQELRTAQDRARRLNAAHRDLTQSAEITRQDYDRIYRKHRQALQGLERRLTNRNVTEAARNELRTIGQKVERLLTEERKNVRRLQRERREVQRLRQYKADLGRAITRRVPKTVDIEYRLRIEALQAVVDPNFRSQKTQQRLAKRRQWFADAGDEVFIPKRVANEMLLKSLDEWTIEQLQQLKDEIDTLLDLGRTKKRLIDERRIREQRRIIGEILSRLPEAPDDSIPDPGRREDQSLREIVSGLDKFAMRPDRLADMIDGRKGTFDGPMHRNFIDRQRDIRGQEIRAVKEREAHVAKLMERYNIPLRDLAQPFASIGQDANGQDIMISLDEALDIYAGIQNEKKSRAIMYGNKIPIARINAIIGSLSRDQRAFADSIIAEYDQHYDRLRDAHWLHTNDDLGDETRYTPMIRRDRSFSDTFKTQMANELAMRQGLRRAQAERGFTRSRIEIAARNQKPISLGLYETWAYTVQKQEHYIRGAEAIRTMQNILKDSELQRRIRAAYGNAVFQSMERNVNRFAEPQSYRSQDHANVIVRGIRRNMALAYLSGNVVTMMKQAPSLAFYAMDAGFARLMSASVELFGGVSVAGKRQSLTSFIAERDPTWEQRSLDRQVEEFRRLGPSRYRRIRDQIGNRGMRILVWMDKQVTAIGWKAVYDKKLSEGLSEIEAAEQARNTTLRTQPNSNPGDLPSILADDTAISLFTQFSNQLNQIWNMVRYDAPASARNGDYAKLARFAVALGVNAVLMYALTNRRPPEPDELDDAIVRQVMNSAPIFGPVLSRGLDGWSTDVAIFAPVESAAKTYLRAKRIIEEGGDRDDVERLVWTASEGIAIAFGMPYIAVKRAAKAVQSETATDAAAHILLGGVPSE